MREISHYARNDRSRGRNDNVLLPPQQLLKYTNTIQLLPTKAITSEVTKCSSTQVVLLSEAKCRDDACWWEVKGCTNSINNLGRTYLFSPKTIHIQTQWLCHTYRITQLDFAFVTNPTCDDILGKVSRHIGSWSINFGRVFPTKCTTTVSAYATIRINNNLATCQPTIPFGSSDMKMPCRIDMKDNSWMQICPQDWCNHMLDNVVVQCVLWDIELVLCRDYDSVDTNFSWSCILYGDLCLPIRQEIRQDVFLSHLCESGSKLVCIVNRHWQIGRCFIGCIAKHNSLITCSSSIHSLCDIRWLCMHEIDDSTVVAIKMRFSTVVSDSQDFTSCDFFDVDLCSGCNLSSNDEDSCGSIAFTGNSGTRVLC